MALKRFDFKIIGVLALQTQLVRLGVKIGDNADRNLAKAVQVTIREIQKSMHGSRTRAKRKGSRVTAKPGVLGIDTGTLRRSIGAKVASGVYRKGRTGSGVKYIEFGTKIVYGPVHEFGLTIPHPRRGIIKMPKRPFVVPGFKRAQPLINQILKRTINVRP